MLCAGIYLLAHSIYRVIVVPPGQEGEVTLVCCGVPMQEERREKLVTQMSKVKSRCKCIPCTLSLHHHEIEQSSSSLDPFCPTASEPDCCGDPMQEERQESLVTQMWKSCPGVQSFAQYLLFILDSGTLHSR